MSKPEDLRTLTLQGFRDQFPDERACLDYIVGKRFGIKKSCPYCLKRKKEGKLVPLNGRKSYLCKRCLRHIPPLRHTIFFRSRTPLTKWFLAIYLVSQAKNGISSSELQRFLGVTYKCAWGMNAKIRSIMFQKKEPLSGIVEADETYMGWRRGQPIHGPRRQTKTTVLGIAERGGEIRAWASASKGYQDVIPFILANVKRGSKLMTDEAYVYKIFGKWGYKHGFITHSKFQWVKGNIHTNSIEGTWSQMKRSVAGTYHGVSRQHLQSYLDHLIFLRNSRLYSRHAFYQILDRL